jgi:type 1 glutamine amidotransferase
MKTNCQKGNCGVKWGLGSVLVVLVAVLGWYGWMRTPPPSSTPAETSNHPATGGAPKLKHLVMIVGEEEYDTLKSLQSFYAQELTDKFTVTWAVPTDDPNSFSNLEALNQADGILVSVRRRMLPEKQMEWLRAAVARGVAIIGIRTASHAWSPRKGEPIPEGAAAWPEWDAAVLGGNYQGHFGKELHPKIFALKSHPILEGVDFSGYVSSGSLYRNQGLAAQSELLCEGRLDDGKLEPVAWTTVSPGNGRVFYTSLGHQDDFASPVFRKFLRQGIAWAMK